MAKQIQIIVKFFVVAFLFFIICYSAQAEINLYFSPYDNCEKQFVDMINSAKKKIKISCFGLTNQAIYEAIVNKRKQGVKVLVCIDRRQSASKYDKKDLLKKNAIETVVKKTWVLEHNKMIVVDDKNAIIGSWNFSGNAQAQDNSIVVFKDEPEMAAQVEAAIDRIYARDK